jgi:hypothetical protein
MAIRPVGAVLLHMDGWTETETRRSEQSHFAMLRTRLKRLHDSQTQANFLSHQMHWSWDEIQPFGEEVISRNVAGRQS